MRITGISFMLLTVLCEFFLEILETTCIQLSQIEWIKVTYWLNYNICVNKRRFKLPVQMPLTDHFSFISNQNQQFTHNLWKRQLNVKRSICIASSFVPYFVIKNSTSCCVIYLNVRCNISMSILYKNVFFFYAERDKNWNGIFFFCRGIFCRLFGRWRGLLCLSKFIKNLYWFICNSCGD